MEMEHECDRTWFFVCLCSCLMFMFMCMRAYICINNKCGLMKKKQQVRRHRHKQYVNNEHVYTVSWINQSMWWISASDRNAEENNRKWSKTYASMNNFPFCIHVEFEIVHSWPEKWVCRPSIQTNDVQCAFRNCIQCIIPNYTFYFSIQV